MNLLFTALYWLTLLRLLPFYNILCIFIKQISSLSQIVRVYLAVKFESLFSLHFLYSSLIILLIGMCFVYYWFFTSNFDFYGVHFDRCNRTSLRCLITFEFCYFLLILECRVSSFIFVHLHGCASISCTQLKFLKFFIIIAILSSTCKSHYLNFRLWFVTLCTTNYFSWKIFCVV